MNDPVAAPEIAPELSQFIENRTYDEIQVGDQSVLTRTLRPEDIQLFAIMSGDVNPAHVDPEYAHSSMFHEVIAHGMWGGALISTVLGTEFPGPGTIYISQTLKFSRPVKVGDTITITVTCMQKFEHNKHMIFDCACINQDGLKVIGGEAEVLAPSEKIKRARMAMPEITISDRDARYRRLFGRAQGLKAIKAAFVHPCDINSLQAAFSVRDTGLMEPVLIGPEARLRAMIEQHKLKLGLTRIINVPHSHAAAARAVELAHDEEVEALVQGSQTTEELLRAVIVPQGLRTARRGGVATLSVVPEKPASCSAREGAKYERKRDRRRCIMGDSGTLLDTRKGFGPPWYPSETALPARGPARFGSSSGLSHAALSLALPEWSPWRWDQHREEHPRPPPEWRWRWKQ